MEWFEELLNEFKLKEEGPDLKALIVKYQNEEATYTLKKFMVMAVVEHDIQISQRMTEHMQRVELKLNAYLFSRRPSAEVVDLFNQMMMAIQLMIDRNTSASLYLQSLLRGNDVHNQSEES